MILLLQQIYHNLLYLHLYSIHLTTIHNYDFIGNCSHVALFFVSILLSPLNLLYITCSVSIPRPLGICSAVKLHSPSIITSFESNVHFDKCISCRWNYLFLNLCTALNAALVPTGIIGSSIQNRSFVQNFIDCINSL